jgi:hypothetical protein
VRSVVVDSGFLIGLFDETDPLHSPFEKYPFASFASFAVRL